MAGDQGGPAHGGPVLGVAGATGAVGQVIRSCLPMFRHEWSEVRLAAGAADVGTVVQVAGQDLVIQPLDEAFFSGMDVVLVDLPPAMTEQWVEYAVSQDVVVIDNSINYRGRDGVPLVVDAIANLGRWHPVAPLLLLGRQQLRAQRAHVVGAHPKEVAHHPDRRAVSDELLAHVRITPHGVQPVQAIADGLLLQ